MEKLLFVYNPASGKRTITSHIDKIIEIFAKQNKALTLYRLFDKNCISLEELIASGGFDGVVVAGGDGSVNTIVKMVLDNKLDIPVGVLPTGTCNDFSRSLGMPTDILRCARLIAQGNVLRTDVGIINDGEHIFVNEVAGGVLVNVSYSTDQNLKKMLGPFAYYINGLSELTNIKPFNISVTTKEQVYSEKALIFLILNGSDMSGFTNVIKDAQMEDGLMDILIFKNTNPIEITDSLLKFVSGGEYKDKNVVRIRTKECVIDCDNKISTTVDGEQGPAFPLKLKMKKQAIKIYC